jgi:cytochrome b561
MEKKTYSRMYRIMHWSIAICLIFILFTIFLRLNWMNKNNVAGIIQDYMARTGNQQLSQESAIQLAKSIRKPMWQWHIYIGYVLVGLFSLRFVLPLFGEMPFPNPFRKQLSAKVKFQYIVYLIFYACIVVSLTTGLFIEFGAESMKEQMEEIHKLSIYYLLAFMVVHIGGVLYAELTSEQGLVSRIISGRS